MRLKICSDHESFSGEIASRIVDLIASKPEATLCLAAGDTPRRAYAILVQMARERGVDFTKCTFFGLDEWMGIPPSNEGSCAFFLHTNLFSRLAIEPSRIHLFDALASDARAECNRMDDLIRRAGSIDLILVGVGMNGHIGFNEPGVSPDLYSHVITLDETTQTVGQKYFREVTTLGKGITLGFRHLMGSRQVMMVASGLRKAEIIRKAIEGPINTNVPASLVREHPEASVVLDQEAATLLSVSRRLSE